MNESINIDNDYLIKILKTMIGIDSVLPHEERLASFIADEIRGMGLEPQWHEIAPGRPNVYAAAEFGPGDKFFVFSGHTDTVPAASDWTTDPFEPVEKDGRLYGLGAINMKSGLACSLAAFRALVESQPRRGRLGLAVVVDQEGCSAGARALLKTEFARCDAMLHAEHFFGDTTKNYLPLAVTGKVLYKLTVRGRAAHAFRPLEGGINAVSDAARIVTALDRLKLREHPLFDKGTVCVLKIEGGYKEYSIVVPEHCEIVITRLTVPGETVVLARADMNALIEELGLDSQVTVEIQPPCYEPYFLEVNSPFVKLFKNVYQRVVGTEPFWAGHRGIVDANVFAGEGGIPTVVFGPRGAGHHKAGEFVEIDSLEPVARIYAETAARFLSE
ncbi:MAG: M20/M25/M40 family metallo-hydrolase [candidate division Zixibacteria bacterium]|nr:M20/M25/M40 family metallo-hydrolase [candidate division Zixibacteria bacterium]